MNRRQVCWLGCADLGSRIMEDKSPTKVNLTTEGSLAPPDAGLEIRDEAPEILDWDFCIEIKPQRPSGTVEADAEFVGRGRPIPLHDPDVRNAS